MSADELGSAAQRGNVEEVTKLLNSGVDIDGIDREWGYTALMTASLYGREAVVRLLLSRGANVNLANGYSRETALMRACAGGYLSIVELLLTSGADHSLQDKDGSTALMHACEGGHLSVVEMLLRNGADENLQNKNGDTCFMHACRAGLLPAVEMLLRNGADQNLQTKDGDTCFMRACRAGRLSVVEILLRYGADQNHQHDQSRDTALHRACAGGHIDVAEFLLRHGANHTCQNSSGQTPIDVCERKVVRKQLQAVIKSLAAPALPSPPSLAAPGAVPSAPASAPAAVPSPAPVVQPSVFPVPPTPGPAPAPSTAPPSTASTATIEQLRAKVASVITERNSSQEQLTQRTAERDAATAERLAVEVQLATRTLERDQLGREKDVLNIQLAERTGQRDTALRERQEAMAARDALQVQLDRETARRRNAEAALHRALYANNVCNFVSDKESIVHLHRCCDEAADTTVVEAIFGGGRNGNVDGETALITCILENHLHCTRDDVEVVLDELRAYVTGMERRGELLGLTLDHALAIRLYTFGSDLMKPYAALNNVFYGDRSKESMRRQLPLTKLLIQSLRALGDLRGFVQDMVVYRSVSRASSPYLQEVYTNYTTNSPNSNLTVGSLLRFPVFTSTTRSHAVLQQQLATFGSDIIYEIRLCAGHRVGVDISHLSCFQTEAEVLLIPPVSMRVTGLRMEGASLYISLETEASKFTYLL